MPSFNWATAFSPWKSSAPPARSRYRNCFNWATASSPWKPKAAECQILQQDGASIGPQNFSVETTVLKPLDKSTYGRFNWATTFSPWNPVDKETNVYYIWALQWGHGIFSVETSLFSKSQKDNRVASIWATAFSPWKGASPMLFRVGSGPCFNWATAFLRGNVRATNDPEFKIFTLQWGHGIFSVEIQKGCFRAGGMRDASIGPRLFSVEIRLRPSPRPHTRSCFNWATVVSPWNSLDKCKAFAIRPTPLAPTPDTPAADSRRTHSACVGPEVMR